MCCCTRPQHSSCRCVCVEENSDRWSVSAVVAASSSTTQAINTNKTSKSSTPHHHQHHATNYKTCWVWAPAAQLYLCCAGHCHWPGQHGTAAAGNQLAAVPAAAATGSHVGDIQAAESPGRAVEAARHHRAVSSQRAQTAAATAAAVEATAAAVEATAVEVTTADLA